MEFSSLPAEFKWKKMRSALKMLLGSTLVAVYEKYGEEGLLAVSEKWKDDNEKASPSLMRLAGVKSRDLSSVAEIIDVTDAIHGIEGEWAEKSPHRIVKIEKDCYLKDLQPQGACAKTFCTSIEGIARGVTGDRGMICYLAQCVPSGDPVCELVVESRIQDAQQNS